MKTEHKETSVGLIPSDWEVINLYDLRNKDDRYSFTGGPFGSDLKSSHYTESGVKIIQLQNIGSGKFIDKGLVYTSEEKADELASCNIFPDDIILAKMAPVARSCKIPDTDDRYVMCSDGIRLSIDRNKYDNEFVFQAINSKYFLDSAESKSTGTTRARIGLNDLKTLPVIVPPLPEQQKIASILSTVDEKIENIDQQIKETQELKKGMMQRLLTKGIRHSKFKDSPLGEIPESWEVIKIGEIAKLHGGFAFKSKDAVESGVRWLKIANVGINKIKWDDDSYLPIGYDTTHPDFVLNEGDVVIAMTRPILGGKLKIAKIDEHDEGALLNQRVGRIQIKGKLETEFAYQFFNSASFITSMEKELLGTDPPNISSKMFEDLLMPLPPMSDQILINKILQTIDDKYLVLTKKLDLYRNLKTGLMQQLLTGNTRVKTPQTA